MRSMNQFGNDLYTGKLSIPFIRRRGLWFGIAIALVLASVLVLFVRPPAFSIEFTGGSQFTVTNVAQPDQTVATEAVQSVVPDATTRVTTVGESGIRVQTDQMTAAETEDVAVALQQALGVPSADVASSFIGPTWGADVTRQSLVGLGIFLVLTFLVLAVYFRTWKMSVAAIVGLVDVLVVSIGVYAAFGFEISPAAVIGFLTILAYSLYDTTVVFDKIRETTGEDGIKSARTFAESVELGVNQTVVRSINTTIVAVLPVAAILLIGSYWLGAQTLRDISLSITVGILVAAYSTLFVAAPLFATLREREPELRKRDERLLEARALAREQEPVQA